MTAKGEHMTQQIVDVEEKREGELWEGRQHRGIIIYFLLIIPIIIASIVIFANWANEGNPCASVAICGDSLVILGLLFYILTNLSQRPSIVLFETSVAQKSKDGRLRHYSFSEIKKISIQRYYEHGKNDFGALQIKGKNNLYFGGLPNPTTFIDKANQLDGLKGKLEVKDYRNRILLIYGLFYGILALVLISFVITSISSTITSMRFDFGKWSAINNGITTNKVSALAIDPKTPTTLYAGIDGVMYKTTNRGSSWNAINNGLPDTATSAFAIDPVTPTTLYEGTNSGVYKSTNDGENWSAVNTGLALPYPGVHGLVIDPVTPTTLYVVADVGVFKSTNGGENWSAVDTGTPYPFYTLAIDPVTPTTIYAGTTQGVYKSTNGGENWNAANTGMITDVFVLAIDPLKPTSLYAGTRQGVYKSTNGGENWKATNTGMTDLSVYTLAIDPVKSTTLYVGTFSFEKQEAEVYMSTNSGGSWRRIGKGLGEVNILAIDPVTPTIIYAGTDGGVYISQGKRSFPVLYFK